MQNALVSDSEDSDDRDKVIDQYVNSKEIDIQDVSFEEVGKNADGNAGPVPETPSEDAPY